MNRWAWERQYWNAHGLYQLMTEAFVRDRGYGPWYQRDAWNTVKDDMPGYPPDWELYEYLDRRYPALVAA